MFIGYANEIPFYSNTILLVLTSLPSIIKEKKYTPEAL